MNRRKLLLGVVAAGAASLSHASGFPVPTPPSTQAPAIRFLADSSTKYRVYDAIGGKGKPDLAPYGLLPFKLAYTSELWPSQDREIPDLDYIRQSYIKTKLSASAARIHAIDIEHWPTRVSRHEATTVAASVDKLCRIMRCFRCSAPALLHGYYGIVPAREYWATVRGDAEAIERWQADNRAVSPIAEISDVIFPSLYTFYEDIWGWLTYASANLVEAKKYGKPVLAFLWPRYHSGSKAGELVPGSVWRQQLELVLSVADGAVLWDWSRATWDEEAPWWRETIDLLQSVGSAP